MNKKADAEGITLTFSVIFLILILTVFWIFSFIDRGTVRKETSEQMELTNININLLNLLRTEVEDITISDLIVESYTNNDYSNLTTDVNNIFNDYFDKNYCWSFVILEDNIEIKKINDVCGGDQLSSKVKLPTFSSQELGIKLIRYEDVESKPTYARSKS